MARQRGIPKPRGLGLSASNAPASEAEPLSGLTVAPQTDTASPAALFNPNTLLAKPQN